MAKGRLSNTIQQPDRVSLPRLGLIKIGEKTDAGKPRSLDYFRPEGKYADRFSAAHKGEEKIQRITVCFFSDEPSLVCNQRFEHWDKNGRKYAYGDDEGFFVWSSSAGERGDYVPMRESDIPIFLEDPRTRQVLTLRFMIPAINDVFGYWQLDTTAAASSIPNIVGTFDAVRETLMTSGGDATLFHRIPFDLTVEYFVSKKPGSVSRFPVLSLIPELSRGSLEKVRQLANVSGLLTADKLESLPEPVRQLKGPDHPEYDNETVGVFQ